MTTEQQPRSADILSASEMSRISGALADVAGRWQPKTEIQLTEVDTDLGAALAISTDVIRTAFNRLTAPLNFQTVEGLKAILASMVQDRLNPIKDKKVKLGKQGEAKVSDLQLESFIGNWIDFLVAAAADQARSTPQTKAKAQAELNHVYFHPLSLIVGTQRQAIREALLQRVTAGRSDYNEDFRATLQTLKLSDDEFQHLSYFLRNGDGFTLLDPETLRRQVEKLQWRPVASGELPTRPAIDRLNQSLDAIHEVDDLGDADPTMYQAIAMKVNEWLALKGSTAKVSPVDPTRITQLGETLSDAMDIDNDPVVPGMRDFIETASLELGGRSFPLASLLEVSAGQNATNLDRVIASYLNDARISQDNKQALLDSLSAQVSDLNRSVQARLAIIEAGLDQVGFGEQDRYRQERLRPALKITADEFKQTIQSVVTSLDRHHRNLTEDKPASKTRKDRIIMNGRPGGDEQPDYENWYLEHINNPEFGMDKFIGYIWQTIDDLEDADNKYDKRTKFSDSKEGLEFANLAVFLTSNLRRSILTPAQADRIANEFGDWIQFYDYRVRYVDFMGPYGDSGLGDGDFFGGVASGENFPDFWMEHLAWMMNENGWQYHQQVEAVFELIDRLVVEEKGGDAFYGEFDNVSEQYDSTPGTPAMHSYAGIPWMDANSGLYSKLKSRVIGEGLMDLPGREPIYNWNPDKNLAPLDMERIFRVAFCCYVLLGGRPSRFADYWAVGASPPGFAQFKELMEIYPLAKEMNLSTKAVVELPNVVTGLKIDRRWLAKMMYGVGIFDYIANPEHVVTPRLGAFVEKFRYFKREHFNHQENQGDLVSDEELEELLWAIGLDDSVPQQENFTRIRNLVRSILLSEEKAKAVGTYHLHHMHLVNARGKMAPHHGHDEHDEEDDDHGHGHHDDHDRPQDNNYDYMKPLMVPPINMLWGIHQKTFRNYRLDKTFMPVYNELKGLHELLMHKEPPKMTGNKAADIEALWDDFAGCIGKTSALRASEALVNWIEVAEGFEYRIRVLFAQYAKKYKEDPTRELPRGVASFLSQGEEPMSLVKYFMYNITNSGQTLAKAKVSFDEEQDAKSEIKLPHPYAFLLRKELQEGEHKLNLGLKEYLVALVDSYPDLLGRTRNDVKLHGNFNIRLSHGEKRQISHYLQEHLYRGGTPKDFDFVGDVALGKWKRYSELRRLWRVKQSLNEDFTPGGHGHSKAKEAQDKEVESTKKSGGKH